MIQLEEVRSTPAAVTAGPVSGVMPPDALWLVNGTRATLPNSKGIGDVVLGIAPDGYKGRRTRDGGRRGQRSALLALMSAARIGREKANRVVSPVIAQARVAQQAVVGESVYWRQLTEVTP